MSLSFQQENELERLKRRALKAGFMPSKGNGDEVKALKDLAEAILKLAEAQGEDREVHVKTDVAHPPQRAWKFAHRYDQHGRITETTATPQ